MLQKYLSSHIFIFKTHGCHFVHHYWTKWKATDNILMFLFLLLWLFTVMKLLSHKYQKCSPDNKLFVMCVIRKARRQSEEEQVIQCLIISKNFQNEECQDLSILFNLPWREPQPFTITQERKIAISVHSNCFIQFKDQIGREWQYKLCEKTEYMSWHITKIDFQKHMIPARKKYWTE